MWWNVIRSDDYHIFGGVWFSILAVGYAWMTDSAAWPLFTAWFACCWLALSYEVRFAFGVMVSPAIMGVGGLCWLVFLTTYSILAAVLEWVWS